MSKKKSIDELAGQLMGYVEEQTSIECSKCDKGDAEFGDAYDSVLDFYKKGWRATMYNVYCPNCAKKYLKKR